MKYYFNTKLPLEMIFALRKILDKLEFTIDIKF